MSEVGILMSEVGIVMSEVDVGAGLTSRRHVDLQRVTSAACRARA